MYGPEPDAAQQAAASTRYSLGLEAEAAALERAVAQAIEHGARTPDIAGDREQASSSQQVGNAVLSWIRQDRCNSGS